MSASNVIISDNLQIWIESIFFSLTLHLPGLQDCSYSLFQYGESTKSSWVQSTEIHTWWSHTTFQENRSWQAPTSTISAFISFSKLLLGIMIACLILSCLPTVTTCSRSLITRPEGNMERCWCILLSWLLGSAMHKAMFDKYLTTSKETCPVV